MDGAAASEICTASAAPTAHEGEFVFFASTSARPNDVAADVSTNLKLSRPLKTLQGQIMFSMDISMPPAELARQLLTLTTVDYIHVMLASSPVSGGDAVGSGLDAIHAACAGVPRALFDHSVALWRAVSHSNGLHELAATPGDMLVFRAIGKRGGRGHGFSSDEAKRAAKAGLSSAFGLNGSTACYHFDVLAQVHCNRFWLGLRLNRAPLAPQVAPAGPAQPEATTDVVAAPIAQGAEKPVQTTALEKDAYAKMSTQAITPCSGRQATIPGCMTSDDAAPVLLSGWMAARMAALGLKRPRDARDAVAPLWELPLAEQLERKQHEMAALVAKLQDASGGGVSGRDAVVVSERTATERGESSGESRGTTRAVSEQRRGVCSPLRSSHGGDAAAAPVRNTCDFSVGRDRSGEPCCGFRLGLAGGADGEAVAPADHVPFVPAWMLSVATELSDAMREGGGLGPSSDASAELPFRMLRLRGSLRTHESVALLTPTAHAAGPQEHTMRRLSARMSDAAARHGQRLVTLLSSADGGMPPLPVELGDGQRGGEQDGDAISDAGPRAEAGAIHEVLNSGLRLRISPSAFFQASTQAAEVLFATVVELVTLQRRATPSLVLDLCCGGGSLGLEVANAVGHASTTAGPGAGPGAAAPSTRVVGIELNESAAHDAQANAARNGLHSPAYRVVCARVEDALDAVLAEMINAPSDSISGETLVGDAVAILDPPRTGVAPAVCKALRAAERVQRIVFISCNPHGHTLRHDYVVKGGSLSANMRLLCAPNGRGAPFRLCEAIPIDLFPHTPHVELVLRFERMEARARRPPRQRERNTRTRTRARERDV